MGKLLVVLNDGDSGSTLQGSTIETYTLLKQFIAKVAVTGSKFWTKFVEVKNGRELCLVRNENFALAVVDITARARLEHKALLLPAFLFLELWPLDNLSVK